MNPLMSNTKPYRSPINIYSNMYSSSVLKELEDYLELPICNECTLYEAVGAKEMPGSRDSSNGLNKINSLSLKEGRTTISSSISDRLTRTTTMNSSYYTDENRTTIASRQSLKMNASLNNASLNGEAINLFDNDNLTNMFLETFPSVLLDFYSNEYNVFYINSSKFEEIGYYKELIDEMIRKVETGIKEFWNEDNGIQIINYFSQKDDFNYNLINVSKNRVLKSIYQSVISLEKKILFDQFSIYLDKMSKISEDFYGGIICRDHSDCKLNI